MFEMSTSRSHFFFFKVVLVTLDLAAVETYINENSLSPEAPGKKFQKRLTVFPGKRCALPNSLAKARIVVRFATAALLPGPCAFIEDSLITWREEIPFHSFF
jgi:hypothetical protein